MGATKRTVRPISQLADAATKASLVGQGAQVSINGTTVDLPATAVALLSDLLEDLSEGRSFAVVPYDLPIGTEAAADVLAVSRPRVAQLLDGGDVPVERIGDKRRVLIGDLVAYRRADDRRRFAELTWEFLDEE